MDESFWMSLPRYIRPDTAKHGYGLGWWRILTEEEMREIGAIITGREMFEEWLRYDPNEWHDCSHVVIAVRGKDGIVHTFMDGREEA